MAELAGNLWELNVAKVIVVDVTDDYRLMQPPMPSDFYPVLAEMWLPTYKLDSNISDIDLVKGFLYDWHESPKSNSPSWYVGVVNSDLAFESVDEMTTN